MSLCGLVVRFLVLVVVYLSIACLLDNGVVFPKRREERGLCCWGVVVFFSAQRKKQRAALLYCWPQWSCCDFHVLILWVSGLLLISMRLFIYLITTTFHLAHYRFLVRITFLACVWPCDLSRSIIVSHIRRECQSFILTRKPLFRYP